MDQTLTPSRLWKKMTSEQRLQAAEAFWQDEEAANDHVQAVLLIAQQKKFRPKTVIGLDETRKARHLASLGSLPDALAARTLIVYHLTHQREMMTTFLDTLGIEHEQGLIKDDDAKPDPEKLEPAVKAIREKYRAEDVSLYLSTLMCQDPETWTGLKELNSEL